MIAQVKRNSARALDRVISYEDKVRFMVLEVLREESGRELAAAARFNNEEFDWTEHNQSFRSDYSETPIKELLAHAQKLFGLEDLDAVRKRRATHKARRAERINKG